MLNSDLKNNALNRLKKACATYSDLSETVSEKSTKLYERRKKTAREVIGAVEQYINTLASKPKELDKSVSEYKAQFKLFNDMVHQFEAEAASAATVNGGVAAGGVVTGLGLAAFGPTAAIGIAMTFGTASTGTAISALSGAAAMNAAMAWLGGGALAVGGGGMAAGQAFLALAGPAGWVVGSVGVLAGGYMMRRKNAEIAEKATRERGKVEASIRALETARREIDHLRKLTKDHAEGVKSNLEWLRANAPADYRLFDATHKDMLAALINHIQSLSRLLNKKVN